MLLPKKLKYGDTIGVIAPASPSKNDIITSNINNIKNLGFNIVEGKYLRKNYGYLAGEDYQRAQDLMCMFENKDVSAIVCYRGGYGSIRTMSLIDWNIVRNNPKIFCGYSDITLLLNYIYKKCGFITFHGPMISSNFNDEKTKDCFLKTLCEGNTSLSFDTSNLKNIETYNEKNISGIICGGNLSMICSSIGTPFEVDLKNKILFIEDVDEKSYAVDRMLTQLLLSGKLNKCKGFIIGHFTPSKDTNEFSLPILTVIKNILIPLNKPIIIGIPFGHDYPNITLPIGSEINISFSPLSIKTIGSIFI
ncbi:muramoyltetrapeptide carboxypeptidase [Clostridium cavendishii DSM 21758]|uniref:Muramoyltetrapeptide carboxypeptidase n=1 Tax=Clostridium cavendishii DSM 21758 TaxID=1121302 RepID=A0A1M6UZP3_9CLOT|nr:LD-carboxypeptidase [Clostridium cavendishii]SHK74673.1 muramoyltetrapeptide carboxypeptidase [Clostridium cavendishii DSM 21758]